MLEYGLNLSLRDPIEIYSKLVTSEPIQRFIFCSENNIIQNRISALEHVHESAFFLFIAFELLYA